jgi:hypothetical protein
MSKELMNVASEQALSTLESFLPKDPGVPRIELPRFGMVSQDKTKEVGSGKNKKIELVAAEGTFYIERKSKEPQIDETGKEFYPFETTYLSEENPEGIIVCERKQLRYYDASDNTFTSSPIYDSDDEIVPLFKNREKVAAGVPAELKKNYLFTDDNGKVRSRLEDVRILYVLMGDELFQMNLRGTSLYSWRSYRRRVSPPTVVTRFGAEHNEKGQTKWSKLTFDIVRTVTQEEAEKVISIVGDIQQIISAQKEAFRSGKEPEPEVVQGVVVDSVPGGSF